MTEEHTQVRRLTIRVEGQVQAVGYRVNARRKAEELGINVDPVNMDDGSVRIAVSGAEEPVREFVEWCWRGPEQARVTSVTTTDET